MNDFDFSCCDDSSTHSASGALRQYREWRRKYPTNAFVQFLHRNSNLELEIVVELATTDLILQVSANQQCRAEDYIAAISSFSTSEDVILDLLDAEICAKSDRGEQVDRKEFLERFPTMQSELARLFEIHEIDLEASKSFGEPNPTPISIPGYRLIQRTNHWSVPAITDCKFELWEASRLKDDSTRHMILWKFDSESSQDDSIESLLEKRSQLSHPALLQPREWGCVNNTRYVVTERLSGNTLGQTFNQPDVQNLNGTAVAQVVLAIHEAKDLIAKSLKVSLSVSLDAIFIDGDGSAFLIDFPFLEEDDKTDPLMQIGLLLFSSCLQESDVGEVKQHLDAGYEPIALNQINSSVPSELNSVYLACVHPSDKRRYKSVAHAMADLQRFIDGKPVKGPKRISWFGF